MKILVVDRDEVIQEMLKSRLEAAGHEVTLEASKNSAVEKLAQGGNQAVIIDPSPLTSGRPVIMNLRRSMAHYMYVLMSGEDASLEQAIKDGANDYLPKPIDPKALEIKMSNADRLVKLAARIGDDSEDFPSAGGVIAKSAFNQLFLSALERADRYGEQTYILFIALDSYRDLIESDGPYEAEYASAKLSQYLVLLRRQSDIIAQTAKNEYALLLQRPAYPEEPKEAARRFAESLSRLDDMVTSAGESVRVKITLMALPTGDVPAEYMIIPGDEGDSA